MRTSDWSSDVCSSDLRVAWPSHDGNLAPVGRGRCHQRVQFSSCGVGVEYGAGPGMRQRRSLETIRKNPVDSAGLPGLVRTGHRSEEHTSELQSLMRISYAVFCLKKKHRPTQQAADN